MSTDAQILKALKTKCNGPLSYFELAIVKFDQDRRKIFLAVGLSSLFLVRRDLEGIYAVIPFAQITKVVQDTTSAGGVELTAQQEHYATGIQSTPLLLACENRSMFLGALSMAWQVDSMCRSASVIPFPKIDDALNAKVTSWQKTSFSPFAGCTKFEYQGYSFFLPNKFSPAAETRSVGKLGLFLGGSGVKMTVEVGLPKDMATLVHVDLSHVRWVGLSHKDRLADSSSHCCVELNRAYRKAMNLVGDVAQWTGWEVSVRSENWLTHSIILRRSHMPPLLDAAQDIVMMLQVSTAALEAGFDETHIEEVVTMAANSLSPVGAGEVARGESFTIYTPMVQAKLDALLFDEEGYRWLSDKFGMMPTHFEKAKVFVKAILKMLESENALKHPELLQELAQVSEESDALEAARRLIDDEKAKRCMQGPRMQALHSAWTFRVARYLFYLVDGGFDSRLTANDLVDNVGIVAPELDKKLREILDFLLHIRSKDLNKRFTKEGEPPRSFMAHARDPLFSTCVFNERVMQILIETGYLQAQFSRGQEHQYTDLLGVMLRSQRGISLKASICRQILAATGKHAEEGALHTLALPLCEVVQTGSRFLGTYATAALVNLTALRASGDGVKNRLVSLGVLPVCVAHLRKNDDDLVYYSLLLLVNLTKAVHHRHVVREHDIIDTLVRLLTVPDLGVTRSKIMTQLPAVLGQLCNEDDTREEIASQDGVIERLCDIYAQAPGGSELKCNVMFCLRQLCTGSRAIREEVGDRVLPIAVEELKIFHHLQDFASSCVLLLMTLATARKNCELMCKTQLLENLSYCISDIPHGQREEHHEWLSSLRQRLQDFQADAMPVGMLR
mmetsp:Transcript_41194/g.93127  ORF Transcript_41194/g.93127 Transcript_41194/m.93127 type:complete len:845 (-) Transcript_41194:32-2566(-)